MKKATTLLLIAILGQIGQLIHSQTNLVCNHSFEEVNQDAFNKLKDAQDLYSTHFGTDDATESLFGCWYTTGINSLWQNGWDVEGVTWGIIPGLFLRYNGDSHLPYFHHSNTSFITEDADDATIPPIAFKGNNDPQGLVLSMGQDNNYGFDLSPPATKFGENVVAHNGSNYVALFDFENDKWEANPILITELKYPLVKDVEYVFSMAWCKMNLLEHLKDTEGWDEIKEGQIKAWVCNVELNDRQEIIEIDINNTNWWVTSATFKCEDNAKTHLLIEYNPVQSFPFTSSPKIGGAFIDNIKLYESCETPDNQCDNARYKRDMLDVNAEEATLSAPNANGTFTTCRVYKIDNAKHFKVQIHSEDMSVLHRTFETDYPGTEWYWDGKDDNGIALPDDKYKVRLQYAYNDCYHATDPLDKKFDLIRDYSVFDVTTTINSDGNCVINGLGNVHHAEVELYSTTGQLLHTFGLENPPSSIAMSEASIVEYGNGGNLQIIPGTYGIHIKVSNNCVETEFEFDNRYIGTIPDSGGDTIYDWSPVPKPATFPCPFDFEHRQNVYSPMNCCEGYLHLENMEIWNSWGEVNIQDSILIGPNVVFEPGTYNYLNAGEQIVLIPDSTGVVISGEAILTPNTFNCEICKSYTIVSSEQYAGDAADFTTTVHQRDSLEAMHEMVLFPNPAAKDQEMTLRAGSDPINPDQYRLVLSNSLGVEVPVKVTQATGRMIRFKTAAAVSAGVYYLYYESNGTQQTFSFVIR